MSEKYEEYCMKFSKEELRNIFCRKFDEELQSKIICITGDGSKIDFDSDSRIETIAFDENENLAIMFWEYQTSIYVCGKELMFIDDNFKGTYTSSDVFDNVVYEGCMRGMSHRQMLDMFADIILCFIGATDVQIIQRDVPKGSVYQRYNYYDPHMFIINVKNNCVNTHSQVFANITINY